MGRWLVSLFAIITRIKRWWIRAMKPSWPLNTEQLWKNGSVFTFMSLWRLSRMRTFKCCWLIAPVCARERAYGVWLRVCLPVPQCMYGNQRTICWRLYGVWLSVCVPGPQCIHGSQRTTCWSFFSAFHRQGMNSVVGRGGKQRPPAEPSCWPGCWGHLFHD